MFDLSFYKNKRVLITGHTGFKGSWMCHILLMAGAHVTGIALDPPTQPSLFYASGLDRGMKKTFEECFRLGLVYSVIGDIRDLKLVDSVFAEIKPEIVIHMAAQPLVRESYNNPVETYSINVMGTVNVLECIRKYDSVKSFVNVTTDKVYLNREWDWGYRENEELNGYDPYSNSKSCSELVTSSYKSSFFGGEQGITPEGRKIAISTLRAGNVIGGGDFAKDRIIPDCIRAAKEGENIIVRNPYSTRPYQHVLEPIMVYLLVAAKQYEDVSLAGAYNVGPDDRDCFKTGALVDLFCTCWNNRIAAENSKNSISWKNVSEMKAPHEANFLKLDCSKLKSTFGWKPVWDLEDAMNRIVEWTDIYFSTQELVDCKNETSVECRIAEIQRCMEKQIKEFIKNF